MEDFVEPGGCPVPQMSMEAMAPGLNADLRSPAHLPCFVPQRISGHDRLAVDKRIRASGNCRLRDQMADPLSPRSNWTFQGSLPNRDRTGSLPDQNMNRRLI